MQDSEDAEAPVLAAKNLLCLMEPLAVLVELLPVFPVWVPLEGPI